jgi:TonB family protein
VTFFESLKSRAQETAMGKAGRVAAAMLGFALGPGALAMTMHMLFTRLAFTLPTAARPLHTKDSPGINSGQVAILTPTQGVDFSLYLMRLLGSLKQNWYAVVPDTAKMGDKGKVVLRFRIQRDGTIFAKEPTVESSSRKEPLDRAAIVAIRNTAPFEPLPDAFHGPYIELRFTFLYNLKPDPKDSH